MLEINLAVGTHIGIEKILVDEILADFNFNLVIAMVDHQTDSIIIWHYKNL